MCNCPTSGSDVDTYLDTLEVHTSDTEDLQRIFPNPQLLISAELRARFLPHYFQAHRRSNRARRELLDLSLVTSYYRELYMFRHVSSGLGRPSSLCDQMNTMAIQMEWSDNGQPSHPENPRQSLGRDATAMVKN
ncbi:hypothetical protein RRG08_022394 [Elysia crispata]|uniref:Uncharacterized protein n=1 Tax=Elysia crispata TaxID=231223 RepID=A0AAE0Z1F4_9GAST|nr:hypothetical protein RRG08_022394 [Elysia crispata]